MKNITQKLINNNATIIKSDKSNSTVVIDNITLENKTLNFINNNNFTMLQKDPTNNYQKLINNLIKINKDIFNINDNQYKLKIDNPSPPKLNTLIKIHKIDKPIRPLINSKTSPNYKISKYITKTLKEKLQLTYKHNLKITLN